MEQQIAEYCKEVKACLSCPPDDAERCTADVRQTVEQLRRESPEITVQEIMEFLGTPRDVAKVFQETMDPVRLERYRKRKKLLRWLAICLSVTLILTALFAAWYISTHDWCVGGIHYTDEGVQKVWGEKGDELITAVQAD